MKGWKEEAREYFFESHLRISDIEAYLKTCEGYRKEKELRRDAGRQKRRAYKAEKNRQYRRAVPMAVTAETMRREHELAVLELSREKYH